MPEQPSYEQVSQLPAHNRLVVPPEFEDFNGHMNIAHYLTTCSWGVEYAFRAAGLPEGWHETDGLGVFTAEHHLVYLREVMVGATVSVRVRFIGRSARALHVQAYLLDETRQQLSYTMELVSVHIAFADRRTAEWPADLAASFDALVAEHATLPWPAPLSGGMGLR